MPHRASLIILIAGIFATVAGSWITHNAVSSNDRRAIFEQLNQVVASLNAAVPAIQQPLTSALEEATTIGGVAAFRSFVSAEVGSGSQFVDASLWSDASGTPRMIANIGLPPLLSSDEAIATGFISSVRSSDQLTVTRFLTGSQRRLGYAEHSEGVSSHFVVYAETALPSTPHTNFSNNSPFFNLDFTLYFGSTLSITDVIETSVRLPTSRPSRSAEVDFGITTITVVAYQPLHVKGSIPRQLPWWIVVGGLSISLGASGTTERLRRRNDEARVAADSQREIANELQKVLVPTVVLEMPGVDVATRYLAGAEHLDIGGDWFDVVRLDAHRLFLVVGDVAGRGVGAAATMAYLRHAIRAYAIQGDGPGIVVAKLRQLLSVEVDRLFATVLCVEIDIQLGRAQFASAGHLPPVIVGPSGTHLVDVVPGTPVGVSTDLESSTLTVDLLNESTLLLYTDGLIERRGESIDEGLARLCNLNIGLNESIELFVDRIMESFTEGGARDDVALLALRVSQAAPIAEMNRGFSWSRLFSPVPESIGESRQFVGSKIESASEEIVERISLMISELATNVVVHAGTDFLVEVTEQPTVWRISVTDRGGGTPVSTGSTPNSAHGRGIEIVEQLSDQWGFDRASDGPQTVVWFEVGKAPPASS